MLYFVKQKAFFLNQPMLHIKVSIFVLEEIVLIVPAIYLYKDQRM